MHALGGRRSSKPIMQSTWRQLEFWGCVDGCGGAQVEGHMRVLGGRRSLMLLGSSERGGLGWTGRRRRACMRVLCDHRSPEAPTPSEQAACKLNRPTHVRDRDGPRRYATLLLLSPHPSSSSSSLAGAACAPGAARPLGLLPQPLLRGLPLLRPSVRAPLLRPPLEALLVRPPRRLHHHPQPEPAQRSQVRPHVSVRPHGERGGHRAAGAWAAPTHPTRGPAACAHGVGRTWHAPTCARGSRSRTNPPPARLPAPDPPPAHQPSARPRRPPHLGRGPAQRAQAAPGPAPTPRTASASPPPGE
jgi:hypothetical protein